MEQENQTLECYKCHQSKNLESFCKCSTLARGYQYACKECERKYRQSNKEKIRRRAKAYYDKNSEIISENGRKYNISNREKIRLQKQDYRKRNKEKLDLSRKIYYQKSHEKIAAQKRDYAAKNKQKIYLKGKRWREANREHSREYQRKWKRKQYAENTINGIKCRLRSRFGIALRKANVRKTQSILKLIGCSIEFLKDYLSKKFRDGMSWENYGKIWHIDHIKCCASFNLFDENEQRKCFHYSNLQPLLIEEHRLKSIEDKKMSIWPKAPKGTALL